MDIHLIEESRSNLPANLTASKLRFGVPSEHRAPAAAGSLKR